MCESVLMFWLKTVLFAKAAASFFCTTHISTLSLSKGLSLNDQLANSAFKNLAV